MKRVPLKWQISRLRAQFIGELEGLSRDRLARVLRDLSRLGWLRLHRSRKGGPVG